MSILKTYKKQIFELCEAHKVRHLYAFGSVLTSNFSEDSDVDLIVDFNDIDVKDYADNYFDFKFSLQNVLNRQIDLLELQAIKNPYFKQVVDQSKELVYGY
jgi:predicted nucleotidyltransferase